MKREIKFRGFDEIAQCWTAGGICFDADIKGRAYITFNYNDMIEVNASTIGQFTGLKDKNGKGIYEGDILKFPGNGGIGQIIWDDYFLGFAIESPGSKAVDQERSTLIFQCEVIGNIHEHKHLIE